MTLDATEESRSDLYDLLAMRVKTSSFLIFNGNRNQISTSKIHEKSLETENRDGELRQKKVLRRAGGALHLLNEPRQCWGYHGLRVGSALLSIVAGCIIIGVSRECDADAVGGIFLGAGGLGMLISVYPFIKAWLNINNILPYFGNFRVHPTAVTPAPDLPAETLRREGTQVQLERSKSRMGTFVEGGPIPEHSPDEGASSDMPDVLARRKMKQTSSDQDLP